MQSGNVDILSVRFVTRCRYGLRAKQGHEFLGGLATDSRHADRGGQFSLQSRLLPRMRHHQDASRTDQRMLCKAIRRAEEEITARKRKCADVLWAVVDDIHGGRPTGGMVARLLFALQQQDPVVRRKNGGGRGAGDASAYDDDIEVLNHEILEGHLIAALEIEQISRFCGGRDLKRQGFQNRPDLAHLVGIRFRKLALANVDRIFQPDPHVGAHDRTHGAEGHLMTSGCENRPLIVVAEELVGDLAHVHQVFGIGPNAAENAKDRLHEERRLYQLAVKEVGQVVKVAHIVAFEFKSGTVPFSQMLKNLLYILERVAENKVSAILEMLTFPLVLKALVLVEQGKEPEVHGTHVEGAHLRASLQRRGQSFF